MASNKKKGRPDDTSLSEIQIRLLEYKLIESERTTGEVACKSHTYGQPSCHPGGPPSRWEQTVVSELREICKEFTNTNSAHVSEDPTRKVFGTAHETASQHTRCLKNMY